MKAQKYTTIKAYRYQDGTVTVEVQDAWDRSVAVLSPKKAMKLGRLLCSLASDALEERQ